MIAFTAYLPSTGSAYRDLVDGGAKIALEVSDTDVQAAWELSRLRGKTFRVQIEVQEEGNV